MARKSRTARDVGLRQVSNGTKWMAGIAAVLTAVFASWEARDAHAGATTPTRPSGSNGVPVVGQQPSQGGDDSAYRDYGSENPGSNDRGYNDPGYSDYGSGDPGYNDPGLQSPDLAPRRSYRAPAASSGGS